MSPHADPIPDALILAAIDRAARHWQPRRVEVSKSEIYNHLAISSRSGPARHVHRRLTAMEAAGILQRSRRYGLVVFSLTSTGRHHLRGAQSAGEVALPESPQHRAWRRARSLAGQEIERFRHEFRACLVDAIGLLEADPPVVSDAFFELAEPLRFIVGVSRRLPIAWSSGPSPMTGPLTLTASCSRASADCRPSGARSCT